MQIASWNVNSLNARLEHFLLYLRERQPDIVLLQELKATTDNVPLAAITDCGYQAAILGQKSYNGVAIIARHPIDDVREHLPVHHRTEKDDVPEARYIEATVQGVRVASVYVPNGMEPDCAKYHYKLAFYQDLRAHLQPWTQNLEQPFVLGGDFNVSHQPIDVWKAPTKPRILYTPQERAAFRSLLHDGLYDTFRQLHPEDASHSWWDYREGRFARGEGWRIDYLLANAVAMGKITEAGIDDHWRGLEKPSDHTVVHCTLRG